MNTIKTDADFEHAWSLMNHDGYPKVTKEVARKVWDAAYPKPLPGQRDAMKNKKIRCWNTGDGRNTSYYVGAYSRAHATRLLVRAGLDTTERHMKTHASECWGNAMNGVTPEVGVWFEKPRWSGKMMRVPLTDLS